MSEGQRGSKQIPWHAPIARSVFTSHGTRRCHMCTAFLPRPPRRDPPRISPAQRHVSNTSFMTQAVEPRKNLRQHRRHLFHNFHKIGFHNDQYLNHHLHEHLAQGVSRRRCATETRTQRPIFRLARDPEDLFSGSQETPLNRGTRRIPRWGKGLAWVATR